MGVPIGYGRTLAQLRTAGQSRASFTTAVSVLQEHARAPISPESWYEGQQFHVLANGRISNVVTAQPTYTWEMRLGPTSNIAAFSSGAVLCSTTAHTTVPWWLDLILTVRSLGAGTAATLAGMASLIGQPFLKTGAGAVADYAGGMPELLVPQGTPGVGTGFDSTVTNVFDLFVGCSASNAANLIQVEQFNLSEL